MNDQLISREALKEAIAEWKYHGFYDKLIEVIDNAPTVEALLTNEEVKDFAKENFDIGYEMAKAKFERPQGEWIRRNVSFGYVDLECSLCHCECECIEADKTPSNFCPNCGAKMQKGGAK